MVAIALIEGGMNSLEAVALIRKQRKGAVNKPQLEFLQKYKKRSKKKGCIVM
jgi:protein tyrosine phosphatase type 4A